MGQYFTLTCCIRIIELEVELKAANRRVVVLEEMVTILKKATAIFKTRTDLICLISVANLWLCC